MRLALLLLVACASPRVATPSPPHTDVPAFHVESLGAGIYVFIYPDANAIVSGNTLVVIGDDGVLVVDSGHFPTRAEQIVAQIRQWTRAPVRYLVNTHWHSDHSAGNGVFQRAFPGLAIVATEVTRTSMIANPESRKQIDDVLALAASGKGTSGKPFDEATKRYIARIVPELRAFLPEVVRVDHVPPTVTFTERMTIYLGKREVQLRFLGRGNTGGDAIVYVPDAKLVATGDLLVAPIPYAIGSFIGEWITTLRALREIPAQTIVPGHGPVMHDDTYLDRTIEILAAVKTQVDAAVAQGRTLDETLHQVNIDALRGAFVHDDASLDQFDRLFFKTAVTRAYREATSGPLHDED